MPDLAEVLGRLGVGDLVHLISRDTIELLEALDGSQLAAHKLAEIVIRQRSPIEILTNSTTRNLVYDALQEQDAADLLALLLPDRIGEEDPWNALKEIPISKASPLLWDIQSFFNVPSESEEEVSPSKPRKTVSVSYGLFAHQRIACLKVNHLLSSTSGARTVLHMPTGSGKTRTAMHIVSHHLRETERPLVVWLAHTEELCEQAASEFERSWAALGDCNRTVNRHFGPHRCNLDQVTEGALVGSLQLLYQDSGSKQTEFLRLGRRTTLVVMDEAHQAVAPCYKHLLEMLAPGKQSILGLTATPGRSWLDVDQDKLLADFFQRNKVTLEVAGFENPIQYLQSQGYLSEIDYIGLPYKPNDTIQLSEQEFQDLAAGFEVPKRIVQALAEDQKRNLLLVNEIIKESANGSKILVFACSVEHANLLADILLAKNVAAAAVTSNTPPQLRKQLIDDYKNSDNLSVLTNYGILTTGFDAPLTDVAVIARPTQSVVLYSQMVGRAARGPRAGGTKRCRILTVVDSLPGFKDLSEGFGFWEDLWENL